MFTVSATDSQGDFAVLKNIYGSHEHKFQFPRNFNRSEFESVEDIKKVIRDQAVAGGTPELDKLFDYLFTPLKSDFRNLTIRCKLCKTQLRFYVNEGKLLLISFENKHVHHNEKWRKLEEKYIMTALGRDVSQLEEAPTRPITTAVPMEENDDFQDEINYPPIPQTAFSPLTFKRIGQDEIVIDDGPVSNKAKLTPKPQPQQTTVQAPQPPQVQVPNPIATRQQAPPPPPPSNSTTKKPSKVELPNTIINNLHALGMVTSVRYA